MSATSRKSIKRKQQQESNEIELKRQKTKSCFKRTYTLTFGDQAETHVGMKRIGALKESGFSLDDLKEIKKRCGSDRCELIQLNQYLDESLRKDVNQQAAILVIRNGVTLIGNSNADALFDELSTLETDKKAKMRGKVVNKRARHNLCFGVQAQQPDYEQGKGRIVAFDSVPLLNKMRMHLPDVLTDKAKGLVVELNDYFDVEKCGIGYHGDGERRRVIGVRLGATCPLHYQWYKATKPVGENVALSLHHGDVYVMSEKAVGFDWKQRSKVTLRHAAGCKKFVTPKRK
mmetsp:Transcript_5540/g.8480  ORF Transcript_5540/g.8480 Transcript_5540/m.8480 type:complete len:288 (+) Transcript_5540:83-946(+)